MPFEKFFLCSRNVFILGCSHTSTTKIRKCFESRALFWGDRPRFPRSLSWKTSRALRRVWHKPEHILEARAFFAFPEMKESKTTGRLCSSLTIRISMVEVSIACVRNRCGLLSIHHASGGMFEERTDKHLSRVSVTRHKVNIPCFH